MGQASTEILSFNLEDMPADGDALEPHVWTAPRAGRVTAAGIGAEATVTAADTNYNTFSLKNGSTEIASLAHGPASTGVTITIGTPAAMTLSTTVANRAFAAGDDITLEPTKTGSGLAVAGIFVELAVEYTD